MLFHIHISRRFCHNMPDNKPVRISFPIKDWNSYMKLSFPILNPVRFLAGQVNKSPSTLRSSNIAHGNPHFFRQNSDQKHLHLVRGFTSRFFLMKSPCARTNNEKVLVKPPFMIGSSPFITFVSPVTQVVNQFAYRK